MDVKELREKIRELMNEYIESNGDDVQLHIAILTDEGTLDVVGYGCVRCVTDAVNRWIEAKQIQHKPIPQISHVKN